MGTTRQQEGGEVSSVTKEKIIGKLNAAMLERDLSRGPLKIDLSDVIQPPLTHEHVYNVMDDHVNNLRRLNNLPFRLEEVKPESDGVYLVWFWPLQNKVAS